MQNINIAGRIGSDAKLAHTQGGDAVCNFSVAVDTRQGREKVTNWWRCSIWGKRADALAPYLLKGVSVAVAGEMSLGDYEGKPQLNVRVGDLTLMGGRGDGDKRTPDGSQGAPADRGGWAKDDLADEIPFISSDGIQ